MSETLFQRAERERIEAAVKAAKGVDHTLVAAPHCDCHGQADCAHETTIECAECNETYTRGDEHYCKPAKVTPETLPKLLRVEKAAWKCVKHYADHGDDVVFENLITDLARVLTGN